MAKQVNRAMIGGFVLIAVGILAASAIIFGSGDMFKKSLNYVLYFQESVKGLNMGSPVLYRGFQVGEVKRVVIHADMAEFKDSVLVYIEIYPESVVVVTKNQELGNWKDRLADLIDRGLRAQLVPQSLITGKLVIELNVHSDAGLPIKRGLDPEYEEIPTIPSTLSKLEGFLAKINLDELNEKLLSILTSADRILKNPDIEASITEFKGTLVDTRKLVNDVDEEVKPIATRVKTTLDDVSKLARHVDGKVDPIADALLEALESADSALKSIDDLVGKRSPTRAEIDKTLIEIQGAARSVRILAEYLEQHPEALLKGKGYKNY